MGDVLVGDFSIFYNFGQHTGLKHIANGDTTKVENEWCQDLGNEMYSIRVIVKKRGEILEKPSRTWEKLNLNVRTNRFVVFF